MTKGCLFEVIAGTYEEFLLGYNYTSKDNELTQSFAAHDHSASVRCVTFCGHYLASGGADDRIFIYDLKSRKQHYALTHHESTVTCLQFTENHSHLMSGSLDGVLAITRVGNWQVEKIWDKAHKGSAVLDIAIHSSGKLALTLGADCTLCTWNLVKGRQAYIINLRSKCKDSRSLEKILWAPDGVRFLLYGGKYTEIWSIESGGVLKQIEHEEKVTAGVWLNDENLIVGHEDGQISVVNTEDGSIKSFKADESRIKSVNLFKKRIVSISSSGKVKVWDEDFEELAATNAGCRLTCLCIVPPLKVKAESGEEQTVAATVSDTNQSKVTKAQVIEIIEDDEEPTVGEKTKKKRKKQGQPPEKRAKKKKKKSSNASVE